MELNFYHVMSGNLVPSVVKLLEKVYDSGKKSVFFSPIEERIKIVDKTLWTFSKNAFIPHGDKSLGFSELQSVYLTSEIENPNQANVLVLTDDFDYKSWIKNSENRNSENKNSENRNSENQNLGKQSSENQSSENRNLKKQNPEDQDFERIIFVFEDDDSAKTAQSMFEDLKNQRENVKYWKQSQSGWEKLS